VSPSCARAAGRLAAYLSDSLAAEERREVREHLRLCASCRDAAARVDPTALFAGLPREDVAAEDVARVVAAVRAGIAWKEAERKLPRRRRPFARIGSAAAVLLMTLLLPAGLRTSREEAAPPGPPGAAARPVSASAPGRPAPAAAGFATLAEPTEVGGPGRDATIYDWTPGSGQPRVVWIVDRSLDI
jgi:hypothetical protein